jgi:hypothetical protein
VRETTDIIEVLLKRNVDRPSIDVRALMDQHIPNTNHVLPGVSILLIDQSMLFKEGWQISSALEATEVFVHDQVPCHVVERLDGEMDVSLNRTVNFDVIPNASFQCTFLLSSVHVGTTRVHV